MRYLGFLLLYLLLFPKLALSTTASFKYPVTLGGFSANMVINLFAIDPTTGHLGLGATTSDTSLASAANTNLAAFFPASGTNAAWAR